MWDDRFRHNVLLVDVVDVHGRGMQVSLSKGTYHMPSDENGRQGKGDSDTQKKKKRESRVSETRNQQETTKGRMRQATSDEDRRVSQGKGKGSEGNS